MSEPAKRAGWGFRITNAFLRRPDLPPMAKIVGLALRAYADAKGLCCPTLIQLGEDLQIDPQTAEKWIDCLRDAGELSWELWTDEFGHKRRNYNLQPPTQAKKPSERLFQEPWDGLGGKAKDGKRTLQNGNNPIG